MEEITNFKEMDYMDLIDARDIATTILENTKEDSQEWLKAKIRLGAIQREITRRCEKSF